MTPPPPFPRRCPGVIALLFVLSPFASAEQVIFSEVHYHPRGTLPEFIEVENITSTPFDIANWKMTQGVDYEFPAFSAANPSATFLKAFERILLSEVDETALRAAYPGIPSNTRVFGPWTGKLDNAGERITLEDKNGVVMCTLSYGNEGRWPVSADGTGHTLVVKNHNRLIDDWRNWRASADPDGTPGFSEGNISVVTPITGFDSSWKFYDATAAPPANWKTPAFDDSGWPEGQSLFGFESGALPEPLRTPLRRDSAGGLVSYYFRKHFEFALSTSGARIIIDQRIDDGVVWYLNGHELGRVRMPVGTITHTTPASAQWEASTLETEIIDADVSAYILPGTNVLSAELHNQAAGSSDAIFGAAVRVSAPPLSSVPPTVVLNEIHFDANGNVDWVEIHNQAATPVPGGSLAIASQPDFSDAVPVAGALAGSGYLSLDTAFPSGGGSTSLFLRDNSGRVIDATRLRPQAGQTGFQAFPDGSGEWYGGISSTRDAANNPQRNTDIVINELLPDPPSNLTDGEFIELYNRGTSPVNLGGWAFSEGVSFTFPPGTTLPPNGYLVVAANRDHLVATYGSITVIGNYSGRLSNGGEVVRLVDASGNLADEVDYRTGGDWPVLAKGDGSSLELVHPSLDNNRSSAWRDSDETQKSSFRTYTHSGVYRDFGDERIGGVTDYKEFHLHLVGDSHVIVKNIELKKNGVGANILQNSAVKSTNGNGATGWLAQGTHWQSHFQGNEFHLISSGHGDNRANKAELDATALNANDPITLTFEARWISGRPRLIAQTFDHSFMQSFLLDIPENLGTPGTRNSAFREAAPPQIDGLAHSPAVPSATEDVLVTARIDSPTAPTVNLLYREDTVAGTGPYATLAMNDSGTGGDAVAGDGVYSARITNQKTQGRIVQFYVEATGQNGATSTQPRRGAERPALYVVDNTRMDAEDLTGFRFVVSQYDTNAFANGVSATYDYDFPRLSNAYKNMTLIVNEEEILYNCEIRPAGSPWHAGDRVNLDMRGKWKLPNDNLFRNKRKMTFDLEGPGSLHHNRIVRYWLYLMGHPVNENEFVVTKENAKSTTFREIVEPVDLDMLNRHWENGSEGELYRADDVFRFDDSYNKDQITDRYWWYAGGAYPGPGRYHTQWLKRSREAEYDYGALINFLKTVSANTYSQQEIERMVDPVLVCQIAAVRGYIGDWDSFTMTRPKNAFFYRKPDDGRFMFFHWDSDLGFSSGQPLATGGTEFGNWLNKPYNRRIFRYYLAEMINNYTTNSSRLNAWFDAEDAASTRYNVSRGTYTGFFGDRLGTVNSELGTGNNLAFAANTPTTTAGDTATITGNAGYRVFEVSVANHPEGIFRWLTPTTWEISGIRLASGANALQIVGLDDDGLPVANQSSTLDITKTSNAPPVAVLATNPASLNVSVTDFLFLDARGSHDPDGGAVAFAWTPPAGLTGFTDHGDGTASAVFSAPGLYAFSVQVTDSLGASAQKSVQAAVYGANGFSSFLNPVLEPYWEEVNVEAYDNFPDGSYHSLGENPGNLTLSVPGDHPYPLGFLQLPLPPPVTVLDLGDTMSYNDSGADLGTAWSAPAYDASSWPVGPGLFGVDSSAQPSPGIQTPLNKGSKTTFYLRREFPFTRNPIGSRVIVDALADDGAVFYLNGQELGRLRMPAGPINYLTPATANLSPEGIVTGSVVNVDGSTYLVEGTNVFAVELHNQSPTSSDIVYGGRLHIASHPAASGTSSLDDTIHPWLRRPMPASGDWLLQTDLQLDTLQFGDFMAGLMIEVQSGATPARYAIGFKNGTAAAVVRVNPSGLVETLASVPASAFSEMTVRMRRVADNLIFEWRDAGGQWQIVHQQSLAVGTQALAGGPFVSTGTNDGSGMKATFDYVTLVNPSGISSHRGNLLISEIMYNPAGSGNNLEFLELYNAGPGAIDLAGFQLLEGEPFGAFTFGDRTIQPGEYLVLVSNQSAFETAYPGISDKIIGSWSGGNLSNSGESITLVDSSGSLVAGLIYDDAPPWPTAPDGGGPSLVLIDPDSHPELGLAANWRASTLPGGSPGAADPDGQTFTQWMLDNGLTDPNADPDGNGLGHLLDYAFGADLTDANVRPSAESVGGHGGIAFRRRVADTSLVYRVEASPDLVLWSGDPLDVEPFGTPVDNGDGTVTLHYRATSASAPQYLRVHVTAQE